MKINIRDILVGEVSLRGPELDNPEFEALKRGIKGAGQVLVPILVKRSPLDPNKWLLIDGLQRVTASQILVQEGDTQFEEIEAREIDATEAKAMEYQIQTNFQRVKSKPAAAGKHIRTLMTLDPTLGAAAIAERLGFTEQWVRARLCLNTLIPEIEEMVDNDQICLNNAMALAKLPPDAQREWAPRAAVESPQKFVDECLKRAKELRDAAREGKTPPPETFVSVQRLRSVGVVKEEYATHAVRKRLVTSDMSPEEAADLMIAWVLHQDNETVEADRAAWEAKRAQKEAEKRARAEKREQEKAAKEAQVSKSIEELLAEDVE